MHSRGAFAESHQLTTVGALAEKRIVVAIDVLLQIGVALAKSAHVHDAYDRMLSVTADHSFT